MPREAGAPFALGHGAVPRILLTVELTAWRKAWPEAHHLLRSWIPASALMRHECSGLTPEERGTDPRLHGAAASVRDEHPTPGARGDRRWSWRIWTPIGCMWPYRSGTARSAEAAMAAADEALVHLAEELGAEVA